MAYSLIQQAANYTAVTTAKSITATFGSTPTANNILIACAACRNNSDWTFRDLSITGWTQVYDAAPSGYSGALFYKIAGGSESTSVTLNESYGDELSLIIAEFSGNATTDVLDGYDFQNGAINPAELSVTSTAAGLAITQGSGKQEIFTTPASGYTMFAGNNTGTYDSDVHGGYKTYSSGDITADWPSTTSLTTVILALFKEPAAPAPTNVYWAILPSTSPDPIASEIVNQRITGAIYGTDASPTITTENFDGTEITGLTADTSYKLAATRYDPVTKCYSNVIVIPFDTTGGGAGVIEALLSYGITNNIIDTALADINSSIAFNKTLDLSNLTNIILERDLDLNIVQDVSEVVNALHNSNISFDSQQAINSLAVVVYEAALVYHNSLHTSYDNNAVLETSLLISNALSNIYSGSSNVYAGLALDAVFSDSESADIAIEVALTLANSLVVNFDKSIDYNVVLTLLNNLSIATSVLATYDVNLSVDNTLDISSNKNLIANAAVLFSTALVQSITTGNIFNANFELNSVLESLDTALAIYNTATSIVTSQGFVSSSSATYSADQLFSIAHSSDFSKIAVLEPSVAFNIDLEQLEEAALGIAAIEASLAFNLINDYYNTNSGNILNSELTVGLLTTLDSISISNLFASATFENSLGLTLNGGNAIEAAVVYAIEHQEINNIGIIIDGTLDLDISQSIGINKQFDYAAETVFAHQVGFQSITDALLNAGLDFTAINSISVNGSALVVELTLPCDRSLTVLVESRLLVVQPEDRTLVVDVNCTN